ncbi:hypothetical protein ABW19_dt0210461 [Dactylella cylindrospora]|nr:hypothetical protein ABW19_dt0210461 [Dactylella cylindrospora]
MPVLFYSQQQSLSFALEISSPNDFETLYSRDSKPGSTFKGLLYVPDLDPEDPCDNSDLVPRNVTRKANLPGDDLKRIAYAPLITPHCSLQYMYSAVDDNIAAFIFYGVPTEYSNDTKPLQEEEYPFEYPVYYLDGAIGQPLMYKLAMYSGNMSEVYNGFNLTEAGYDIRDYARIYAVISTANSNPMPGLWLFLLVVVAVLLFIIGASSLLMHLCQFHYRRSLRRRIANGEVDLEALGVGRITVPREFLAKFPVYVYISDTEVSPSQDPQVPPAAITTESRKSSSKPGSTAGERGPNSKPASTTGGRSSTSKPTSTNGDRSSKSKPGSPTVGKASKSKPSSPTVDQLPNSPTERAQNSDTASPTAEQSASSSSSNPEPPAETVPPAATTSTPAIPITTPVAHTARGYSQTSCPICLEDFVHQETTVRELPCLHIFHADCIDPYLESQSSLCVLCKQSCLPKGYVPIRLTNAIVRRERLLRRVRQRSRQYANGSRDIQLRNLRRDDGGFMFRWSLSRLRRQEEDMIGRQALSRYGRGSQSYNMNHRVEVLEDPVRPRWRETMDRIFPGFR